jgi:pilus assembly protein Flp/PilA
MEKIKKFFADESGNATEYGLIIALVSVAIIFGAGTLGTALGKLFTDVGNAVGVAVP